MRWQPTLARAGIGLCFGMLLSATLTLSTAAQDVTQSRRMFTDDLSMTLLATRENFRTLPDNLGWIGVVLAPPGTSLAPIVEAYNGYPGELSQSLANATVFDRPIKVADGLAVFDPRSIDAIWADILTLSRPGSPLPRDRMLQTAVMKWLFKPIYKKGKVVGYTQEPSRYVQRYREFSNLYSLLQQGKSNDMWRLDSRLRKYASFQEARSATLMEWYKSGYKGEIETATWSFDASVSGGEWLKWADVSTSFESHRLPIDVFRKLPETYLLPPPASWSSVSSWIRAGSKNKQGGEYRFQISRIKVERPWFDVDALFTGRLSLPQPGTPNGVLLSEGTKPSFEQMPNGVLSAFVSELILIRDVRFNGAPDTVDEFHPLAGFAYPDAINLIGYIVRVLPKTPMALPKEDSVALEVKE